MEPMEAHISVFPMMIYIWAIQSALEAELTFTLDKCRQASTPMKGEGGLIPLSGIRGPVDFDTRWEKFSVVGQGFLHVKASWSTRVHWTAD